MSTPSQQGVPGVLSAPQRPVDALVDHLDKVVGQSVDEPLLLRALTHRSFAYEHGGLPNNERLEFLGDSVLGLVVTETLYRVHPDLAEGHLAKLRAAVVNMRALADVARSFSLGEYVMLGKGEEATGGRDKASILADTMEALIGTVFISCGIEPAGRLVHHHFDPLIEAASGLGAGLDWKTSLQEMAALSSLGSPDYRVAEQGPDHEKEFHARVVFGDEVLGEGHGRSKKQAEQQAAQQAWASLSERRSAAAVDPAPPSLP
ncbi:ribonuclease III [Humibacillus sp. DSM 29435]|uniref:ribonuclease III n=1 Tax=Humibacillus sp. DSM 29435 TaxID=1869167 RepID=UPI000872B938|nr:ribonuclease III [Humibacillus sp. DSM 29435]OFE16689.1 ribonuclease III [Humibacillus sp. DSM 29435]